MKRFILSMIMVLGILVVKGVGLESSEYNSSSTEIKADNISVTTCVVVKATVFEAYNSNWIVDDYNSYAYSGFSGKNVLAILRPNSKVNKGKEVHKPPVFGNSLTSFIGTININNTEKIVGGSGGMPYTNTFYSYC